MALSTTAKAKLKDALDSIIQEQQNLERTIAAHNDEAAYLKRMREQLTAMASNESTASATNNRPHAAATPAATPATPEPVVTEQPATTSHSSLNDAIRALLSRTGTSMTVVQICSALQANYGAGYGDFNHVVRNNIEKGVQRRHFVKPATSPISFRISAPGRLSNTAANRDRQPARSS